MALVALLRGINVGGHRSFRPALLAAQLQRLGVVNVGAAGTFVVRARLSHAELRRELQRRIPFECDIAICAGPDIVRLLSREFFAGYPERSDRIRFVSVLVRAARTTPPLPLEIPAAGGWLVRVLARERRFLVGVYRRRMAAIGALRALDDAFGAPAITRSWNTMRTVAGLL